MGNFLPLLEVNFNESMPLGEGALYGLQMLLVGMLIIFSVLSLLWLSLEISGAIFRKLAGKTKPVAEKKVEATAPVVNTASDTELIAVLTAAIAAMESAPACRFRVVSFKRK